METERLLKQLDDFLDHQLVGKDPRKVKSKREGTVMLLLRDDSGVIHRRSVVIGPREVNVFHHADGAPTNSVLLRASLVDGIRYVVDGDLSVLPRLEVYGETALMEVVRNLTAQVRGALNVRLRN